MQNYRDGSVRQRARTTINEGTITPSIRGRPQPGTYLPIHVHSPRQSLRHSRVEYTVNINSANCFHLSFGDRLTVGNNRQRLKRRSTQTVWFLTDQRLHIFSRLRNSPQLIAARYFGKHDAAPWSSVF